MSLEENLHTLLTIAELITVSGIAFQILRTYNSVRSSFNLGLVIFTAAMIIHVVLGYFPSLALHMTSEAFELAALIIFLRTITK